MKKPLKINAYSNPVYPFNHPKEMKLKIIRNEHKATADEKPNKKTTINIGEQRKTYSSKYLFKSFNQYTMMNLSERVNRKARVFVNRNVLPTKETIFDRMLSCFNNRKNSSKGIKDKDYSGYKINKGTSLKRIEHSSCGSSSAKWEGSRKRVYTLGEQQLPDLIIKQLATAFIKKSSIKNQPKDLVFSKLNNYKSNVCRTRSSELYKVKVTRSNSYIT